MDHHARMYNFLTTGIKWTLDSDDLPFRHQWPLQKHSLASQCGLFRPISEIQKTLHYSILWMRSISWMHALCHQSTKTRQMKSIITSMCLGKCHEQNSKHNACSSLLKPHSELHVRIQQLHTSTNRAQQCTVQEHATRQQRGRLTLRSGKQNSRRVNRAPRHGSQLRKKKQW